MVLSHQYNRDSLHEGKKNGNELLNDVKEQSATSQHISKSQKRKMPKRN